LVPLITHGEECRHREWVVAVLKAGVKEDCILRTGDVDSKSPSGIGGVNASEERMGARAIKI
jgi:hypothetical protein